MTERTPSMKMRRARISAYELARVTFPSGRVTSGAGQAYLRRLDAKLKPAGYAATVEGPRWNGGYLVITLDETGVYNVSASELRSVVHTWL